MFVCSWLLLLLLCCPASAAEKETKWLLPRTNVTGPSPNDYECESARAPDYYGIGVRLVSPGPWLELRLTNIHDAPASLNLVLILNRVSTSHGSLVGW